jgi:hypothetical protein
VGAHTTELNQKIINLAIENNCWIRYGKTWFTPAEFDNFYGPSGNVGHDRIEILNPLKAYNKGSVIIKDMVIRKDNHKDILQALERLLDFSDKIIRSNYKPVEGQVDAVEFK